MDLCRMEGKQSKMLSNRGLAAISIIETILYPAVYRECIKGTSAMLHRFRRMRPNQACTMHLQTW